MLDWQLVRDPGHFGRLKQEMRQILEGNSFKDVELVCSDGSRHLNKLVVGVVYPALQAYNIFDEDIDTVIVPEASLSDEFFKADIIQEPLTATPHNEEIKLEIEDFCIEDDRLVEAEDDWEENGAFIQETEGQIYASEWKCRYCSKKVKSQEYVESHHKHHETYHRCYVCQKVEASFWKLRRHMQAWHDQQAPEVAERPSNDSEQLVNQPKPDIKEDTRRRYRRSEKRPFQCQVCKLYKQTQEMLAAHVDNHLKHHKCSVCNKVLTCVSKLKRHMAKHGVAYIEEKKMDQTNPDKRLRCTYCKKPVASAERLAAHLSWHEARHKCPVCDRVLASPSRLRAHADGEHGLRLEAEPAAALECSLCHLTLLGRQELTRHYVGHFEGGQCPWCAKPVANDRLIKTHIARHTTEGAGRCCQECGLVFSSEDSLRQHLRRRHADKSAEPNLFCCEVCGKGFAHRHLLERHAGTHSKRKPYPCNLCGKRFRCPSNLRRHGDVHADRQLMCEYCEEVMKSEASLRNHIRRQHLEAGPPAFVCAHCGKRFRTKTNWERHERRHSLAAGGGYFCPECPSRCKSQESLRNHIQLRHVENVRLKPRQEEVGGTGCLECSECRQTFRDKRKFSIHMSRIHMVGSKFTAVQES